MQVCAQAISESFKNCLQDTGETEAEQLVLQFDSVGMRADREKLQNGYLIGQKRGEANAVKCDSAYRKVKDECGAIYQSFNQAITNNGRDDQARAQQIATMPDGPAKIDARISNSREHAEINQKLNAERDTTNRAAQLALEALKDGVRCNVNQARLYAAALAPGDDQMASLDLNNPAPTTSAQGDAQGDGKANPKADGSNSGKPGDAGLSRAYSNAQETAASTVMTATGKKLTGAGLEELGRAAATSGKTAGLRFAGLSALQGDPIGVVGSTASTAAEYLTPMTAARVANPLIFFSTIMVTSSPAGRCSTVISDPIRAYSMNCPLNTGAGAGANEKAIASLEQN